MEDTNPFVEREVQAAKARFEKRMRHRNGKFSILRLSIVTHSFDSIANLH